MKMFNKSSVETTASIRVPVSINSAMPVSRSITIRAPILSLARSVVALATLEIIANMSSFSSKPRGPVNIPPLPICSRALRSSGKNTMGKATNSMVIVFCKSQFTVRSSSKSLSIVEIKMTAIPLRRDTALVPLMMPRSL